MTHQIPPHLAFCTPGQNQKAKQVQNHQPGRISATSSGASDGSHRHSTVVPAFPLIYSRSLDAGSHRNPADRPTGS